MDCISFNSMNKNSQNHIWTSILLQILSEKMIFPPLNITWLEATFLPSLPHLPL